MDGIQLDSAARDGVLNGVSYAVNFLDGTINNIYLWTIATMFIGLAIGIGIALWLIKGHSTGGSLASYSGNGVTDAMYASEYLKRGGDIKNAYNQEFIRAWAKNNI